MAASIPADWPDRRRIAIAAWEWGRKNMARPVPDPRLRPQLPERYEQQGSIDDYA